jgi:hypothetical protein
MLGYLHLSLVFSVSSPSGVIKICIFLDIMECLNLTSRIVSPSSIPTILPSSST